MKSGFRALVLSMILLWTISGWGGVQVPVQCEPFTPIYKPGADVFAGPSTQNLEAGTVYSNWVVNDHCFVKGPGGKWHCFGITHPATSETEVHEGEWQLFHISSPGKKLGESLFAYSWTEHPKILEPAKRMGERNNCHAPSIVKKGGVYYMFYGPIDIRLATSKDLFNWEPRGTVFSQNNTRDPSVMYHKGRYYMVYLCDNSVCLRSSKDLLNWSSEPVTIYRMKRKGYPESPSVVYKDGWFYLFWCIWDDTEGAYDKRSYVYRSKDIYNFDEGGFAAELEAHAPEIIKGESGKWYISSAEWPSRGVSLARLNWEKQEKQKKQ